MDRSGNRSGDRSGDRFMIKLDWEIGRQKGQYDLRIKITDLLVSLKDRAYFLFHKERSADIIYNNVFAITGMLIVEEIYND